MLQNLFFRFGAEIRFWRCNFSRCCASSIVLYSSISRYRIVMAASRLLGAAAACVVLLSFAAGHCKSWWSGCIEAAIVLCQQIFSILAPVIFLLNSFWKVLRNRVFLLWRRDPGLEVQFLTSLRVVLLCLAIQYLDIALYTMAASSLLGAAAACIILLSFAAGHRKS